MFLGREEKAVSAGTADSVGSIDISKVTGVDVPRVYGTRVDINFVVHHSSTRTWEAPSSGLLAIHGVTFGGEQCKLNNTSITRVSYYNTDSSTIEDSNSSYFPVQKGDVVTVIAKNSRNGFLASLYPLQLIKEVTENE